MVAGALGGAAAGALVPLLLRTPLAAALVLLSRALGRGVGMAIGVAIWLVPDLLARPRRAPGDWRDRVAVGASGATAYGWLALRWFGPGAGAIHFALAGALAGALTALFKPKSQSGEPLSAHVQEWRVGHG